MAQVDKGKFILSATVTMEIAINIIKCSIQLVIIHPVKSTQAIR